MRSLAFALSMSALLLAGSATAVPITFGFTATVNEVLDGPGFSTGLANGDSFSGSFTFESTTADVDPDPSFGDYQDALLGVTVVFPDGILLIDTDPSVSGNFIRVAVPSGYSVNLGDLDGSSTYNGDSLVVALFANLSVSSSVADDSLPLDPSVLGTGSMGKIEFLRASDGASVTLQQITVDSIFAVPEPGLAALLGIGASLLALRRERALG